MWEAASPITFLPASSLLGAAPKGRVYAFYVRDDFASGGWLTNPKFAVEWLDPVGQTLNHTCDSTRWPAELCGRYELDYTAFGARTRAGFDAIAVWTGEKLKVLVLEPWENDIVVSPDARPKAWAGHRAEPLVGPAPHVSSTTP